LASTADNKIVPISAASGARRVLTTEVAVTDRYLDRYIEMFDVARLVHDSSATRSDLRIIEESDDEVQQCIETRVDKLLGVDWRLEGGSQEVRDWLTAQLRRHYETIIQNSWNAKLYGYNVMERIWKKDGAYWVVDRLSEKPFEWFTPKRDDTLWYRPFNRIVLPENYNVIIDGVAVDTTLKFLLTRNKPTYKNPRGKALLAYLFWPWFYRKATWQFWMQFLERNAQPLLIGKSADPAQMVQQLALAVQDAVIAIPLNAEVDSVGGNHKGDAFNIAEDRLVRRIQKVILGQTLTSDVAHGASGGSSGGARALGQVHNEVREDKTLSDLKLVGPVLQNYIDALITLNFPSSRGVRFVFAVERGLEGARATRDATLANTGQVSFTEQYYMREYGFQPGDLQVMGVADKAKADAKKQQADAKAKQDQQQQQQQQDGQQGQQDQGAQK
jgi:phage gp29-like protein